MASLTQTRPLPRSLSLRLPILDAYLLREITGPFLVVFFAFFIFWGLNIFFIAADYEINRHAPFFVVLRFVLFRVPQAVPMAFPFATLFAGLFAMGRLMGDNEVTAMRTSGIPLWRFALTPMLFSVAMFFSGIRVNEYISPASVELSTRSFYQMVYNTDSLPVESQFFRKDPDTRECLLRNAGGDRHKTMIGVQIFRLDITVIGVKRFKQKLRPSMTPCSCCTMPSHALQQRWRRHRTKPQQIVLHRPPAR